MIDKFKSNIHNNNNDKLKGKKINVSYFDVKFNLVK